MLHILDRLSDTAPPNPLERKNLDLTTSAVFSIVDFLAQAILIYHCWIVWRKNLLVVFVPGFLALAALGGEFALVGLLGTVGPDGANSILGRFLPTGITAFSFSLAVNALTSCLILNRMWVAQERAPSPTIQLIASITMESGIIIVFTQLIWVVLFSLQHPAFALVEGPIIQIYGITPTLLIIRTTSVVVYGNSNEFELESITRVAASVTQAEDMHRELDKVSEKSVGA
ncbi:hypothetical protein BD779DRAFT_306301 [Infundibulicybe gibba]|nr:hypothetical protein BD779DRAFT_306301 [Infundibulicybe gibba]